MDAKQFAINEHSFINQTYAGKYPYDLHLNLCMEVFNYFRDKIYFPEGFDLKAAEDALPLHDTLEDSWRLSYNDLLVHFGFKVAEIVYLLKEEKGRTRAERHNHKYFTGIASMDEAILDKLCDNIANVIFGCYSGSGMYKKYKAEYPTFKSYLYKEEFKIMFDLLEQIYFEDKLPDFWSMVVKNEISKYE